MSNETETDTSRIRTDIKYSNYHSSATQTFNLMRYIAGLKRCRGCSCANRVSTTLSCEIIEKCSPKAKLRVQRTGRQSKETREEPD